MKRYGVSVAFAVTLACTADLAPTNQSHILLSPLLDSMFVGELLPRRRVVYYDTHGTIQDPGTVQWASSDPAVLSVDSTTGKITSLKAGVALVLAQALGVQGSALVAVSGPFQVTLLQDSVYLMPGDTFTVPVHVSQQAAGTPTVWFTAATNPEFDLDSASGKDSAKAPGGPVPFVVHAALGADTSADSGTVEVVQLTDTLGGKAAYTTFSTVIRSRKLPVHALNFHRRGDTLTFRLRASISKAGTTVELIAMTLRTAPLAPGSFAIDSISPTEVSATHFDPYCRPPRSWGVWSITTSQSQLQALSRLGGVITITQMVPVANGKAVSGRFYLPVQRLDLYDDPLAIVPIQGTFVAPLTTSTPRCE
jgi:hypothetical protein